jgi:peptidyl-prolyl cis-trans isomerase D
VSLTLISVHLEVYMLKTLSKLEKTRGIVIILFVLLMAVSLVVFWTPGGSNTGTLPSQSTETLATVGSDYITVGEVVSQRENMQRISPQYAMMFNEKRILDGMIRSKVVAQEAARLGLMTSDAELRESIIKQFKGTDGQFIGWDRYQQSIKNNGGDIEKFEQGERDRLSAQKLEALITAGVSVTDQEVLDDYKRTNTEFELMYIAVATDKLAQNIKPSDDDLKAYFEQHKKEYYISVPQKKIRYLFIETAKVGEKLSIPDEDLRKEYDQLAPDKKQAGVKLQQIVLRVANEKLDATVKAKADELVKRARGESNTTTEQAFADLAKGNSEDPATAKNGGWLSKPYRKNPNNPSDPFQQVLDLPVGAVSEPIKHRNIYYIFRRGDDVPKSFEDAKNELLVSARNRRAYAAAAALAQKAVEKVKATKDIQKVVQELAAEANMSPANMVKETPYIKPGDDVPNIGVSQQFEEGIKDLNNKDDVGDRTPIKDGFAIPMLVDKKDPRDAELSEVKDKITDAVKKEKAKAQLEQTAKDIANAVNGPADMKAVAEKYGLKALEAKAYKLGSPLGEAGADQTISTPALENAIYEMKEGGITKTAIKAGDNYVIVGATKRKDADMAKFEQEKQQLKESALTQKRNQIFSDYIQNIMDKMKKDGQIVIKKDVLARITQENQQEGFPGGFPGQIPQ